MVHAEFDPLEPAFQVDPYPGYAWLRDHEPVHHHPGDHRAPAFWALSRFEDVWQAVRRPEIFSSASGLTFFRDEIGQLGLPPTIVMLDPPVQTRLRALIGRLLARVAIEELFAAHPRITVDRASGQRHVSAFVRGWVSLPAHGLELTSSW